MPLENTQSTKKRFKEIEELFAFADVSFNGSNPWDIQVHDTRLFNRIALNGSLGLGEAYIDGWWDCESLDQLFTRVLHARLDKYVTPSIKLKIAYSAILDKAINKQNRSRAWKVGQIHYDTGNDLFERMLDSSMNYSCGYWKNADNLEQAQIDKMDMICRKLKLESGMSVLDIGCGWGGLATFMAKNYNVDVVGITISKEQKLLAEKRAQGLPVKILLEDYRNLKGQYDRVVSVGMFEHVGIKNYPTYFSTASQLLKEDGLFLLHTIGIEDDSKSSDRFIEKYIFPNGRLPDRGVINAHSRHLLRLEDWHNFGPDYDKTLMVWHQQFEDSWTDIKDNYSEPFYRMWRYYLLLSAGFFRSRYGQLWQLVFTKPESMQVYRSIR